MSQIVVEDYNPLWAERFEELRSRLWPAVRDLALAIEHVGSTSVPGLSAKPVIDLDVVVASARSLPPVITRLEALGYEHRGNLGIEGREAFRAPAGTFTHHLYVCVADCLALRNHLLLRDYLRAHADTRESYGALKRELARKYPDSIDDYVDGKTEFILGILQAQGLVKNEVDSIGALNRLPRKPTAGFPHRERA